MVENNDTLKVGFEKKDKGDQTIAIFNNQSRHRRLSPRPPTGSQTITVFKDRNRDRSKTGNETVTIEKGKPDPRR